MRQRRPFTKGPPFRILQKTTPVGIEPTRGDPIGLAGRCPVPLDHSVLDGWKEELLRRAICGPEHCRKASIQESNPSSLMMGASADCKVY